MTEYENLRKMGWVGFAEVYLNRCDKESKSENIADLQLYTKLVEFDTRFGTTAGTQLYRCLYYTTRWDIIKVLFFIFGLRLYKIHFRRLTLNK